MSGNLTLVFLWSLARLALTAMTAVASDKNNNMQYRRSDYDVTNTVQVSSVVRREARGGRALFANLAERHGRAARNRLRRLRAALHRAVPRATTVATRSITTCSTASTTRLRWCGCSPGYDRTHAPELRLGAERAMVGIVVALFHDAGYIRQTDDTSTATAPSSPARTSGAARSSSRATCRRSAWATGCRWPRRSCTSPDTRCRSTRSASTTHSTARSATSWAPRT